MTPDDVDAGLRLCRLSHWNQVARDWEQFLRLSPGGATVAVDDAGVVIGSVATMRYAAAHHDAEHGHRRSRRACSTDLRSRVHGPGCPVPDSMAWIAMVLVDPAHRGGGIGTALLQRGLAQVADVTTVGLDATPLGQPLYEALGFRADSTLTRMRREPAPPGAGRVTERDQRRRTCGAPRLATATRSRLSTRRPRGLDRRAMLAWLQSGAPELAWVCDGDRRHRRRRPRPSGLRRDSPRPCDRAID